MKHYRYILIAVTALALAACTGINPSSDLPTSEYIQEKMQQAEVDLQKGYYKGQVQVMLSDSKDLESFVQRMALENGIALSLLDQVSGQPIYLFEVEESLSVEELAEEIKADQAVEKASPNFHIQLSQNLAANDPDQMLQWALSNDGQEAPDALAGRAGADISFNVNTTKGSKDIVVAVVDTGIDYLHEDLAITEKTQEGVKILGGNLWMNPDEVPNNGLNEDNNGGEAGGYVDDVFGYDFVNRDGDPRDDQGHGTHVAGVIGALRNNFIGMVGMNEEVSLMGVKFLSASGSGSDFGAIQSIFYVVEMKKRFPEKQFIMNCSWGAAGRSARNGDEDDFMLYAFKVAAEHDILTVAAAGNSGESTTYSPHYPSNYSTKLPAFLSVAATTNVDQIASFSNYGKDEVQVAAPGVLIYSTIPGNQYAAWSGTSMATPHVAGLAALVWAQEPELSAEEVKQRIISSVDILPQLKGYVSSSGRINVQRALDADINIGIDPILVEIPKKIASPQLTGSYNFDHVTTITEEGASEISVCFSSIHLTDSTDWLQVYGSDYRVRDLITGNYVGRNLYTGEAKEVCSAPVPGDTIHLRLVSNSSVDVGGGLQVSAAAGEGRRGFVTEAIKVVR